MNNRMQSSGPLLEGVRVIDLSTVLAGPYCTMLLGDLGADIIKIEKPGTGDDTRHWGPPYTADGRSAYFLCVNRNKRSMTLNLKAVGGLEVLRDLIRQGDILIENYRVDTLENWRLGYEPPFLGQSTDEILSEVLNYGGEKIQKLRAAGVV